MSRFDECDAPSRDDLAWEALGDDYPEWRAGEDERLAEVYRRQRGLRERRWAS